MVRLFSVWTHFHPPLEQMLLIQCQVNLEELICGSKMNSTISKPEPYGGGLMDKETENSSVPCENAVRSRPTGSQSKTIMARIARRTKSWSNLCDIAEHSWLHRSVRSRSVSEAYQTHTRCSNTAWPVRSACGSPSSLRRWHPPPGSRAPKRLPSQPRLFPGRPAAGSSSPKASPSRRIP
jgi:hypothetical protein